MFVVAIDRLRGNGTANPSEEIVPALAILGFFVDEMFANQINFGLFPTQKLLCNIQKLSFCCPRCLERVCPGYRRCRSRKERQNRCPQF